MSTLCKHSSASLQLLCSLVKQWKVGVKNVSLQNHDALRILSPVLTTLYLWSPHSLRTSEKPPSISLLLILSISEIPFYLFLLYNIHTVALTLCLSITSHTFIICLGMIALKDDVTVLEFGCVWDDSSHQTSHAPKRQWSQQYFGQMLSAGQIPSTGQIWRKEAAKENFPVLRSSDGFQKVPRNKSQLR